MSGMRGEIPLLTDVFAQVSTAGAKQESRQTTPFSIRLTKDERAYLEARAGRRALGAYCRNILLAGYARKRKELAKPRMEDGQYAALLAALGESRLSSNLNQLAKHANMGTLDVAEDTERQLQDAYRAVLEMRKALFIALGLKAEAGL